MKLINDHPLFSWAACSNPDSGIAKICIAHESFWLKDCYCLDHNVLVGTVDNIPCATHLHGLRLGDTIHFVVNNPPQNGQQRLAPNAAHSGSNASARDGAASLAFTQCQLILPDGSVIVAALRYVAYAYSRGPDQYPAHFVQFTAEQSATIDAILEDGEDAVFIAECINCAIAEGDCVAGSISSLEEDPAKEVKWKLLA